MRFFELKNALQDYPVFSTRDIIKLDPRFHSQRLTEWQQRGYIRKLTRDFYTFTGWEMNEAALYYIANRIYAPSYISLEMALSYYNFIPEGVYGITSATTMKTKTFNTGIAEFIYRHLKVELMFGFKLMEYQNHFYKIADREKALLDFLYLNSHINSVSDFLEMRFNINELNASLDLEKVENYLSLYNSKLLHKRVKTLLGYLDDA